MEAVVYYSNHKKGAPPRLASVHSEAEEVREPQPRGVILTRRLKFPPRKKSGVRFQHHIERNTGEANANRSQRIAERPDPDGRGIRLSFPYYWG